MDAILIVVVVGALWGITAIALAVTLGRVAAQAEHDDQMDQLYRDTRLDEIGHNPTPALSDA